MGFLSLAKNISKGKSITRSLLDTRLKKEFLVGEILDLGSGKRDLYSTFIPRDASSSFTSLDVKQGQVIDFEKDALPYSDNRFDVVLLLNVLEHLYNYQLILKEIVRIKKEEGVLIGFVPFLKWYHPDPQDFFRYTNEALKIMLVDCGYREISIEVVHRGPYTAALDMVLPTVPKLLRPTFLCIVHILDSVFIKLRGNGAASRYALGYYFRAK